MNHYKTADELIAWVSDGAETQFDSEAESLEPLTPQNLQQATDRAIQKLDDYSYRLTEYIRDKKDQIEREEKELDKDAPQVLRDAIAEDRRRNGVTPLPATIAPRRESGMALGDEYLQNHPPVILNLKTIILIVGIFGTALIDIGGTYYCMRQRSIDVQGNFQGSSLELFAISCMTLLAYVAIGILLERNYRGPAVVLYAVVLCLLAMCLWSGEVSKYQEIWNQASQQTTNVFASQSADTAASSQAPTWFLVLCDFILAFAFTWAGLVFIFCKAQLLGLEKKWTHQVLSRAIKARAENVKQQKNLLSQQETMAQSLGKSDFRERIRRQIIARALRPYDKKLLAVQSRAASVLTDVRCSAVDKDEARAVIGRVKECRASVSNLARDGAWPKSASGSVMAILLALSLVGFSATAHAQSTADLCQHAPVLQVLIDVSGSSPARNPDFITAVMPLLERTLRNMPPCSQVLINTVGDARLVPMMRRTRIQMRTTPDGATVDDIARGLRQLLTTFPARIDANAQGQSELIGGFADASRNLNKQARSPNVIVMLSDLVENSTLANCESGSCHLPPPPFALDKVDVTVYGVGLGLSSRRAMALTTAWQEFLGKAGAHADLRRTF